MRTETYIPNAASVRAARYEKFGQLVCDVVPPLFTPPTNIYNRLLINVLSRKQIRVVSYSSVDNNTVSPCTVVDGVF